MNEGWCYKLHKDIQWCGSVEEFKNLICDHFTDIVKQLNEHYKYFFNCLHQTPRSNHVNQTMTRKKNEIGALDIEDAQIYECEICRHMELSAQ